MAAALKGELAFHILPRALIAVAFGEQLAFHISYRVLLTGGMLLGFVQFLSRGVQVALGAHHTGDPLLQVAEIRCDSA